MVPRRVESLRKLGFSNEAERQYLKQLVNFRTKLKDKLESFGQTLLLLGLTLVVEYTEELFLEVKLYPTAASLSLQREQNTN